MLGAFNAQNMGQYHVGEQKNMRKQVEKKCLQCLNIFSVAESEVKRGNGKYCSRSCSFLAKKKYGSRECEYCQKEFQSSRKGQRFCSQSCSARVINPSFFMSKKDLEKRNIKISNTHIEKYGTTITCKNCEKNISSRTRRVYCSKKCNKEYRRKDMDNYRKYKIDCKFNFSLSDYPEEFNFYLIEKYGWYKPSNRGDNLKGVSRDHMFSVRHGFDLRIDPAIINHPANCELMVHSENISKNYRSSIGLSQLIKRIETWENKYGG